MRVVVFGAVVLATCAGCATGMRATANGNGNVSASPATSEVNQCVGWYYTVARVCDSIGD